MRRPLDDTVVRLGWNGALDGVRAIAVLLVLLFHYGRDAWLPGGFLGVDIFFVLSGFLITTLLLEEWRRHGVISLQRFYARRVLRLLPAFSAFLLTYMALVLAFPDTWLLPGQDPLDALRHAMFAMGYLHNWIMASGQDSPHSFGHIWTLAVEMQFYLVWPVVLIFLLRTKIRAQWVLAMTCAAAALSAISMVFLGRPTWEMMYYGTHFRAHELLIGAVAAQLFVWQFVTRTTTDTIAFRALLVTSVILILVLARIANEHYVWMFTGGYQLAAVAAAVIVVYCASASDSLFARALAWRPLGYLGRRSYAIYLWHLPVGYALRRLDLLPEAILALIITIIVAEISYRLIERPALRLKDGLSPRAATPEASTPSSLPAAA